MLLCALFACAMAFPAMIWSSNIDCDNISTALEPISILLLKAPFLNDQKLQNYRIDGILEQLNYDLSEPYLVKSIQEVYDRQPGAFTAIYECDNSTFSPPECLSPDGHLVFNFSYAKEPMAEILYNYAFVPNGANARGDGPNINLKLSNQPGCNRSTHDLTGDWRLTYYKVSTSSRSGGSKNGDPVYVSSPWNGCTTPRPWYHPGAVPIC